MSTASNVHLTLRAVRLLELCEAEGFERADDPTDPKKTTRVLTIMLAAEY